MARIDNLPPLREVVAAHGLSARKALGQNFLFDLNLTSRIARSAGSLEDTHVIEVGPGPGGLTRAILAAGAKRVTAIETDERCLAPLAAISGAYPDRLQVIHGDALAIDMASLVQGGGSSRIIANLPYNVASPLIIGWLQSEPWPPWFESITVMVQREYAERLVATPEQRSDYGRLSVLTALRAEARILFNVPPSAFFPPPKVMSTIVQLTPKPDAEAFPMALLEKVTAAAFGQRRKMLRQSLKPLGNALALLEAADIAPEKRAEEIPPEGYLRLVRLLEARNSLA
jgi:16S rRNA (adenine1518-N6/adenine1519-N6)-dimethyltransferase